MRSYYFYSQQFPESVKSVQRYAAKAKWVNTGYDDPQLYPRFAASVWGQDDMVFIEQDIVLEKNTLSDFKDCPEPWCVNPYRVAKNNWLMTTGLGCTRFRVELQKELDYNNVLEHNRAPIDCPNCVWGHMQPCGRCPCHSHQDTALWHSLMAIGYANPHLHTEVKHLHEFNKPTDLYLVNERNGCYGWSTVPGHQVTHVWAGTEDPCPNCNRADLLEAGSKKRCPVCHYIQPCCNP
jgi:hypothetical protein